MLGSYFFSILSKHFAFMFLMRIVLDPMTRRPAFVTLRLLLLLQGAFLLGSLHLAELVPTEPVDKHG